MQVQFQQNSTEAHEDKDPKIFLQIEVIIDPPNAILKTDVTLNFSVVDGNTTGKTGICVCYKFQYISVNE